MKPKHLLVLLVVAGVSQASRPPWYKPCWIYLCGVEVTDPVCAWDPRHGARLFRNDCEMSRHNFCYNRNYAIIDGENNVAEDMKLCNKLKTIVENAEEGKQSVVEDGNVRVHFLEDPSDQGERNRLVDQSQERQQLWSRRRNRFDTKRSRFTSPYEDSGSSNEDSSFLS